MYYHLPGARIFLLNVGTLTLTLLMLILPGYFVSRISPVKHCNSTEKDGTTPTHHEMDSWPVKIASAHTETAGEGSRTGKCYLLEENWNLPHGVRRGTSKRGIVSIPVRRRTLPMPDQTSFHHEGSCRPDWVSGGKCEQDDANPPDCLCANRWKKSASNPPM